MLSRLRQRLTFANVTSVIALSVALTGGAFAAANFVDKGGKIHGCVGRKGNLKVVKSGHKCPRHTKGLSWNQRGRRGLAGPAGTALVFPMRFKGDFVAPTSTPADLPLSRHAFTQKPHQTVLFYGKLVVDIPASCNGGGGTDSLTWQFVDGTSILASGSTFVAGDNQTVVIGSGGFPPFATNPGVILEPDPAASNHDLHFKVNDSCNEEAHVRLLELNGYRLG